MKTFLLFGLVALVSWILEGAVRYFPLPWLRWDGIWILVLFLGLTAPLVPGSLAVFLLGLGQEAVGGSIHGPIAFSYLLVYFFLRVTKDHLFFEGKFVQAIWVFLLTLFQKTVQGALLAGRDFPFVPDFFPIVASGLLHAATALALFPLFRRIWKGEFLRA